MTVHNSVIISFVFLYNFYIYNDYFSNVLKLFLKLKLLVKYEKFGKNLVMRLIWFIILILYIILIR